MLNRLFSKYSVTRPLNHISTLPYAKSSNINKHQTSKILKVRSILWPLMFFWGLNHFLRVYIAFGGREASKKIYLDFLCWCCTVFERQRWWWCSQSSSIISDLVSIRWIREVWILVNLYWGKRFELLSWSLQLTKVVEDWDMASSVPKTKRVRRKQTNATFTF